MLFMEIAFWLRIVNVGLALFVMFLCLIKLFWNDTDRRRQARIVALGGLAASIALGSYELLREPFSMRIPIATVSMAIAAYGMKGMSMQPETFKAVRKST